MHRKVKSYNRCPGVCNLDGSVHPKNNKNRSWHRWSLPYARHCPMCCMWLSHYIVMTPLWDSYAYLQVRKRTAGHLVLCLRVAEIKYVQDTVRAEREVWSGRCLYLNISTGCRLKLSLSGSSLLLWNKHSILPLAKFSNPCEGTKVSNIMIWI